ncbi:MAG: NAD(+) synthase [Longimicrobiales bacterium]
MSRIRVALAQVNALVGDFSANVENLTTHLDEARRQGADLIAFPELAVCGYPPEDLLLKPAFAKDNREAIRELCRRTEGLTAVVGFVDRGLDLYNAAAILHNGEWVGTYRKQRLPNYGVFDELRYFQPGAGEQIFLVAGAWVGVSICEDIWLPGGPAGRMSQAGADVVVNINASPFHRAKWAARHRMLATRCSDNGVVLAYVNRVGGQDELVFDGDSIVIGADGTVLAEAEPFEEQLLVCDIELDQLFRARLHDPRRRHAPDAAPASVQRTVLTRESVSAGSPHLPAGQPHVHDDLAEVYRALVVGTRDYVRKNGFERVLMGLSGGIDSSMVATIAVDALGAESVTGVSLPSRYSSPGSRTDAQALAETLGIPLLAAPIERMFEAALDTLGPVFTSLRSDCELRAPGFELAAEGQPATRNPGRQSRPRSAKGRGRAEEGADPKPATGDVTEENIQARIRGVLLMALSNEFGWLLLSTGNKSELATGYSTLYGDMAGGFAVIKDVPKTLLYALAQWRNAQPGGPVIPEAVLMKPPSAELRPDQKDADSLPPYELLDPILERYVEEDWSLEELVSVGFDEALVRRVITLVDRAEYKRRQAAPGVKITARAFGKDRRLPITSRYGANSNPLIPPGNVSHEG